MKTFLMIFGTVFLAELGDKTQLATLLFATEKQLAPWQIFSAAAGALILSTLIAVMLGNQVARWISPQILKTIAGIGFIAIGIWTLWKG